MNTASTTKQPNTPANANAKANSNSLSHSHSHSHSNSNFKRFDSADNAAHAVIGIVLALLIWAGLASESHGQTCGEYGIPVAVSCGDVLDLALRECDRQQNPSWLYYRAFSLDIQPGRKVTMHTSASAFDPLTALVAKRSITSAGVENDDLGDLGDSGELAASTNAASTDSLVSVAWTRKGGYLLHLVTETAKTGDTFRLTVECTEGVRPAGGGTSAPPPPPPPPPAPASSEGAVVLPRTAPDAKIQGRTVLEVTGKVLAARRVSVDRLEVDLHPGAGVVWTVACKRSRRSLGACAALKVGSIASVHGTLESEKESGKERLLIVP